MIYLLFAVALTFSSLLTAFWDQPIHTVGLATSESSQISLSENWAAWSVQEDNQSTIMVSQYDPSTLQWTSPQGVSNPQVVADSPKLFVSPAGGVVIVWEAGTEEARVIQAIMRPEPSDPWLGPYTISGIKSSEPFAYIDKEGNALFVWCDKGSIKSLQYKQEFKYPAKISKEGGASGLKLAVNSEGQGVIIWEKSQGNDTLIQTAQFDPQTASWSAPVILTGALGVHPEISINAKREAFAAWCASSEPSGQITTSFFDPVSNSWSLPTPCLSGGISEHKIALSDRGHAVVVGVGKLEGSDYLWATFYDPESKRWSTEEVLAGPEIQISGMDLSSDPAGNTLVTWSSQDLSGASATKTALYSAALKNWSFSDSLPSSLHAYYPKVTFDKEGNYMAGWVVDDTFFASQPVRDLAPLAPLNLKVERFFTFFNPAPIGITHVLEWTPPLDPSIVSYKIRYLGSLLEEIPAGVGTKVSFAQRDFFHDYIYEVTSVNAHGKESLPMAIKINGCQ